MDANQVKQTLEAISSQAHDLARGSNPVRPEQRTKTEQVAALVERLADTVKAALGVTQDGGRRPALPRADD